MTYLGVTALGLDTNSTGLTNLMLYFSARLSTCFGIVSPTLPSTDSTCSRDLSMSFLSSFVIIYLPNSPAY